MFGATGGQRVERYHAPYPATHDIPLFARAGCSPNVLLPREALVSLRHPIIAVAGSSGAGTSPIMQTFQQISRREGVTAAFVEGGSFHRYRRSCRPRTCFFDEGLHRGVVDDGVDVVRHVQAWPQPARSPG